MRRTAAALATVLLAALVLSGPFAATSSARGSATISCPGATATPACALLDQAAAQLAPIQPVLSLAGPTMAQLAPSVAGLATRADQPGGVSASVVTTQAQALLGQLAALPEPVRGLLAAAQLDGLTKTLQALVAQASAAGTGQQQAAQTSKPTPAQTDRSAPAPATSTSSGAPTLGGSLAAPTSSGGTTSSPAVPDVPAGDSLTFAPLALPDFGFDPAFAAQEEAAAPAPVEADVQLSAKEAAATLPDGSGTQVGVVVVLSLLLLGGAFAAQAHQNRHTIPD